MAGVATLAVVVMRAPASAAPIASPHVLGGSLPRWLPQQRQVGRDSADRVNFGVLLKMRDADGAVAALASISDPASADYGAWLTQLPVPAVIDSATGAVLYRVKPGAAGTAGSWRPLSDAGSGLLLTKTGTGGAALIVLDPATGSQLLATELPDRVSVVVHGQVDQPSDG